MRERCYHCFRPRSLCFCAAIPLIDNQTDVLILQHVGERFHAFNTARIVKLALQKCDLVVAHNRQFSDRLLPISSDAGLLYPHPDARLLDGLSPDERPGQLIIIDGTWPQAKTIVRDTPQLQALPCYRLAPTTPGQYRIRREPNAQSLSTLEATVAAMQALESDTTGMQQLLAAFHEMVEKQLSHPETHAVWRRRKDRDTRPRNLPRALQQESVDLVVAYGEATPSFPRTTSERSAGAGLPISWVAHRLKTGERFAACLEPATPLTDEQLGYMRLELADFDGALSPDEFREQWQGFIGHRDVVSVYHQRTFDLLERIQATQPRCLVLKSIFRNRHPVSSFRSLEELLDLENVPAPSRHGKSRAEERLEMAIALVENLM